MSLRQPEEDKIIRVAANLNDPRRLEWTCIPNSLEAAIKGLTDAELDVRGGPNNWSIRETIHHLVEANLIAANIFIAALANSGGIYDWSWVNPDRIWMQRMGYDKAPLAPALAVLSSLSEHLAGLISVRQDALSCEIQLLDSPGAKPRKVTVQKMLDDEVKHAEEHLREIETIQPTKSKDL